MTINELYSRGVATIYERGLEKQKELLDVVCTRIRNITIETLMEAKAFYVPDSDYMIEYFGAEIMYPKSGCYLLNNICVWEGYAVFPLCDVFEEIVGFAGFDPIAYFTAKESDVKLGNHYYSYTTKDILKKGNFMYGVPGAYRRAIQEGYTCLTDGLFDCLSLADRGYVAHALLASVVSVEILAQLRFLDKVIFISDNDEAGLQTYRKLTKHLDNVVWVKQGIMKDVDALLNTAYEKEFMKNLDDIIKDRHLKEFMVELKHPRTLI